MRINRIPSNRFEKVNSRFENNKQIAFNGIASRFYGKATEGIAKGLGKFANTNFVENTVKFLNGNSENKILRSIGKFINVKEKWFQHAIALESAYITSFYMYNTKKSKEIPEDQKRPMMTNQALVTTLCTILGYTIDSKISKMFNKVKHVFTSLNVIKIAEKMKDQVKAAKAAAKTKGAIDAAVKMPLKHANAIANGISKMKSVLVFGFIYRYFSPVFITPIANRVSEFFDKKQKTTQQTPKISPMTVQFASLTSKNN